MVLGQWYLTLHLSMQTMHSNTIQTGGLIIRNWPDQQLPSLESRDLDMWWCNSHMGWIVDVSPSEWYPICEKVYRRGEDTSYWEGEAESDGGYPIIKAVWSLLTWIGHLEPLHQVVSNPWSTRRSSSVDSFCLYFVKWDYQWGRCQCKLSLPLKSHA